MNCVSDSSSPLSKDRGLPTYVMTKEKAIKSDATNSLLFYEVVPHEFTRLGKNHGDTAFGSIHFYLASVRIHVVMQLLQSELPPRHPIDLQLEAALLEGRAHGA